MNNPAPEYEAVTVSVPSGALVALQEILVETPGGNFAVHRGVLPTVNLTTPVFGLPLPRKLLTEAEYVTG